MHFTPQKLNSLYIKDGIQLSFIPEIISKIQIGASIPSME